MFFTTDVNAQGHQEIILHKAIKRLYCTRPSRDAITQGCQSVS